MAGVDGRGGWPGWMAGIENGVTCPVLLLHLHPDSSPFIPVETMAGLKRALPDARLQVFAHARHGLPFSHAAECAAAVAGFIDGYAASAGRRLHEIE